MKSMSSHWPAVLTFLVWSACFFDFRVIGSEGSDALGRGLLYFYILMPICALVTSLWYGYMLVEKSKWLIVPVFGALEVLLILLCSGDWDVGYYLRMSLWTMIPSAIGMIIGSVIGDRR